MWPAESKMSTEDPSMFWTLLDLKTTLRCNEGYILMQSRWLIIIKKSDVLLIQVESLFLHVFLYTLKLALLLSGHLA